MTHTSTEQERAEFEKYMLLENYFSERDLVRNGVDGYDCTDADDAFGIWLIARRAQGGEAAPVQMPDALLSLEVDAHYIFNNPPGECPQAVRDVIEWYAGSIRQLLADHGIQEQST